MNYRQPRISHDSANCGRIYPLDTFYLRRWLQSSVARIVLGFGLINETSPAHQTHFCVCVCLLKIILRFTFTLPAKVFRSFHCHDSFTTVGKSLPELRIYIISRHTIFTIFRGRWKRANAKDNDVNAKRDRDGKALQVHSKRPGGLLRRHCLKRIN